MLIICLEDFNFNVPLSANNKFEHDFMVVNIKTNFTVFFFSDENWTLNALRPMLGYDIDGDLSFGNLTLEEVKFEGAQYVRRLIVPKTEYSIEI